MLYERDGGGVGGRGDGGLGDGGTDGVGAGSTIRKEVKNILKWNLMTELEKKQFNFPAI